ncbi:hypothetical protein BaRGS_00034878, partial [Batillaria attramentaria]
LCSLIAFAVFASRTRDLTPTGSYDFDYSFYLAVTACLLSTVAAILFGVATGRRDN